MRDLLFNDVLFQNERKAEPRFYFIHTRVADEILGRSPPGSFARHLARLRHYHRLLRPKHKRGHRKYRDA